MDVLKEHCVTFSTVGNLGKTAAVIYKMLQAPGDTTSSKFKVLEWYSHLKNDPTPLVRKQDSVDYFQIKLLQL
jgi:hypothetical protein